MSDSLNLKIARHLRPGDVIIHAGHPADLIDVVDYGPEVLLIWGVSWDDQISVGSSEAFNVLNRFPSLQAAPAMLNTILLIFAVWLAVSVPVGVGVGIRFRRMAAR